MTRGRPRSLGVDTGEPVGEERGSDAEPPRRRAHADLGQAPVREPRPRAVEGAEARGRAEGARDAEGAQERRRLTEGPVRGDAAGGLPDGRAEDPAARVDRDVDRPVRERAAAKERGEEQGQALALPGAGGDEAGQHGILGEGLRADARDVVEVGGAGRAVGGGGAAVGAHAPTLDHTFGHMAKSVPLGSFLP